MKIFNVQVKEKAQTVEINLDFILQEKNDGISGLLREVDYIEFPDLTMDLNSKYGHHATSGITEIKEQSRAFDFYDANMKKFNQTSRIYQLPTKLPAAVYLIQNIVGFINKNSEAVTHYLTNERDIQNDLKTVSLKKSKLGSGPLAPMMALFYADDFERTQNRMVNIQKTKFPMKDYLSGSHQNAVTLVTHLLNEIFTHCMKINSYKDITQYIRLYLQTEHANTTLQESEYAIQNTLLTTFSQELFNAGRMHDLEIALEALRLQAIRHLLLPCIGKQALDKLNYHESYSECQFLKFAKFSLGQDGLIRITEIKNNPAYQSYYTKGRTDENSLKSELLFLGKLIGLEFAEDSDFDNKIVFTKECSQRLIAKNLHLMNIDAFKISAPSQNLFHFFKLSESDKPPSVLPVNDATPDSQKVSFSQASFI